MSVTRNQVRCLFVCHAVTGEQLMSLVGVFVNVGVRLYKLRLIWSGFTHMFVLWFVGCLLLKQCCGQ